MPKSSTLSKPLALLAALALCLGGFAGTARAFSTVVVDPGHGGQDRGGIPGQRIAEKTMTLDVGLRLQKLLQTAGYNVVMTRTDDTFIPLPDRCSIADRAGDAIFVSIHFDAYRASHADGVTTIYYTGGRSKSLAWAVHRCLIRRLKPDTDRGVQSHCLFVLHHNRWPCILVEGGYLTSPAEGQKILDPAYRQQIAQAIADGIADYAKDE